MSSLKAGDRILLKRGSVFRGHLIIENARGAADKPIVVDAYGTGRAPVINASSAPPGIHIISSSFLEIRNLEITADAAEAGSASTRLRSGVRFEIREQGDFGNIRLRGLYIHDIFNREQGNGIGIEIVPPKDSSLQNLRIANICIDRCRIERTATHGIRMKQVNRATIANNRLKDTGGPGCVCLQSKSLTIRDNIVDHSGSAVDPRMRGRGSGMWVMLCSDVLVEHNKFQNAGGVLDSCGFHIDIGNRNVLIQYNLSIHNAGGFVEILGRNRNCAYRYNISVNDGWRVKGKDGAVADGHLVEAYGFRVKPHPFEGPSNNYIYNNTIFVAEDIQACIELGRTIDGLLVANNVFHVLGSTKNAYRNNKREGNAQPRNIFFTNNLMLREKLFPDDLPGVWSENKIGDARFVHPGGFDAADYIPTNRSLVHDQGIVLTKLPGDPIGLKAGLAVERDILGNPVVGRPDLGAVELGDAPAPRGGQAKRGGR